MSGEATIRLTASAGIFLLMALLEIVLPHRQPRANKPLRWINNLALVALNVLALRMILPLTTVGIALMADESDWGLFNIVMWPDWLEISLSVIVLDFVIYWQHVLFHYIPWLWRLHRVHHADLDLDVTTGLRFHTLEILLSALIKIATVLALGASPLSVLIFEIMLNGTSMFNHGNVRLPRFFDSILRTILVTPDMHRVHHSIVLEETNSNFGFNVPWWDRLFGTYRHQPTAGQDDMTIGISDFREERQVDRLHWMLALPFISSKPR